MTRRKDGKSNCWRDHQLPRWFFITYQTLLACFQLRWNDDDCDAFIDDDDFDGGDDDDDDDGDGVEDSGYDDSDCDDGDDIFT